MNAIISLLIAIFFISSICRIFIAVIDANNDDKKSKSQEQQMAELQKRVYELEAKKL